MPRKTDLSHALFEESLKYVPGGVHSPVRAFRGVGGEPFFAKRAQGSRVWDVDGNSHIDYVCTWGPSILGHAHPAILKALAKTMQSGTSFGIPHPRELDLAKLVCDCVPSVEKVRFCNSGTEATMSAIRLARGFTKRDKIIKFEGCYHGHVDSLLVKAGSGALTLGTPDSAGVPAALAALTITLPFNNPDAVQHAVTENPGQIAALILEPVPANAGLYLPRPGYLETLRKICTENGIVLIFDEVMTGFRVSPGGVQEREGIRPDLSCFGKVIGGGLPVGAFGGRRDIMDCLAPLGPVYQAGTLSGNPLAMAAGLANLATLFSPDRTASFKRLESLTRTLAEGMAEIARSRNIPFQGVRYGSLFCGYFCAQPVHHLDDAKKSDTARFAKFFHALLDRGVYLAPSQFEAGFLSLAHTESDIEETLRATDEAMATL
ncbi:MAG: glutamate-1-semialdehyde 2,1-aminomutase [Verrucomicrobiae bacterium]|nr:glutamate-1-semialdehyde 2,1-aminomutase [Verrucomicrobiae bacterium]